MEISDKELARNSGEGSCKTSKIPGIILEANITKINNDRLQNK